MRGVRRRIAPAAAAAAEGVQSLVEAAPAQAAAPEPPSPVNGGSTPRLRRFAGVVEKIFDTKDLDIDAEFKALMEGLELVTLTPVVVDDALNKVQAMAMRAHRLYVLAQLDAERFRIDSDISLGALRDAATAELERERQSKQRTKNITDADVRDTAATMFPEQWREGHERKVETDGLLSTLSSLCSRWNERSWALGKMKGRD